MIGSTFKEDNVIFRIDVMVFCFIWLFAFMVFAPSVIASRKNKSEHIPMEKIVEFSLLKIKGKLQEKLQNNEQLAYENATIRKDMNYLRRVLEGLAVQKSQLSGKPPSTYYSDFQDQSEKIADKNDRKRRTRVLIGHFENDNRKLGDEIRLIERKLESEEFDVKRKLFIKSRDESRQSLISLQKQIKGLDKSGRGPINAIESLQSRKAVLEQEVYDLQSSIYAY